MPLLPQPARYGCPLRAQRSHSLCSLFIDRGTPLVVNVGTPPVLFHLPLVQFALGVRQVRYGTTIRGAFLASSFTCLLIQLRYVRGYYYTSRNKCLRVCGVVHCRSNRFFPCALCGLEFEYISVGEYTHKYI